MQNIQQLFAVIPLRRVKHYLERNGWQPTPHADPRVTQYGSPEREGAEPCRVLLVESEEHPAYRRYLPNLVFAISVFEDRPAYDVAEELAGIGAKDSSRPADWAVEVERLEGKEAGVSGPAPSDELSLESPDGSSNSVGLVFRHENSGQTHVWLNSLEHSFPWRRGDRLEIRAQGGAFPEVSIRDDALLVRLEKGATARVLLSSPANNVGGTGAIREIVCAECGALTAFDLEGSADELAESLERTLRRIEFDLAEEGDQAAPSVVQRRIALVVTSLAQRLSSNSRTVELLWRLAQRIAGLSRLAMEATPRAAEELALMASGDSAESPFKTLAYLERLVVRS